MNDSTDKPRKTLTITRKLSGDTSTATPPENGAVRRTGKASSHGRNCSNAATRQAETQTKPNKPARANRKPRQPPKPKKTPPSDIRARELSDSLNAFTVWRTRQPLALGIEKQIFQHIAAHHLLPVSACKLPGTSTPITAPTCKPGQGGQRFNLDGTEAGRSCQVSANTRAVLAAMPQ
ncbi:MAG: hypothetical protein R3E93_05765 [Thiothrix sp.]